MANVVPVSSEEKKRMAVLKQMTPAGQEVAKDLESRMSRTAQGLVVVHYDMGARVRDVLNNKNHEETYGTKFVAQLADYLALPGGEHHLYDLRNFSSAFDRDYIKTNSARCMSNGGYLSLGHWLGLMRLEEQRDREKLLNRIFKESFTVNQLEMEIRASGAKTRNVRQGGRKPAVPTSAMAGLQKAFSLGQSFFNFRSVMEKSVFDRIDEMPPDEVNPQLLVKLKSTRDTITKADEAAQSILKRLDENIDRAERVLAKKKAAKQKGKKTSEASTNGESPRRKKKKRKKQQPEPATA
ncbi:MAG: hypothetical protein L0312_16265 [Acidobacteria bacterium]|nr:hypothetical protein [Acidobacteriota bacterium]